MTFAFSKRSLDNLHGVHPDLARVVTAAIKVTPVDFGVIEGLRTPERQKELLAAGKSWTKNSRHLHGMAVDFAAYVDGILTWDVKYYAQIAAVMKQVGHDLGIPVRWGGDWAAPKTDSDHLELDPHAYPDEALIA